MAHRLSTVARKLLQLFGKGGKHWIQDNENDREGNYCLLGGLSQLNVRLEMEDQLDLAIEKHTAGRWDQVAAFNDGNNWKAVKKLLCSLAFPKKKETKHARTKAKV